MMAMKPHSTVTTTTTASHLARPITGNRRGNLARTGSKRHFSERGLSTLESLVLECALEDVSSAAAAAGGGNSSNTNTSTSSPTAAASPHQDTSFEMAAEDYAALQQLPGNLECADCGDEDTEWASVTFGILLCAHCSGAHRAMGTHISRVRSIKMDAWSDEHLQRMKEGGNAQWNAFYHHHQQPQHDQNGDEPQERYNSSAAELYKQVLQAKIDGKPLPAALPAIHDEGDEHNDEEEDVAGKKEYAKGGTSTAAASQMSASNLDMSHIDHSNPEMGRSSRRDNPLRSPPPRSQNSSRNSSQVHARRAGRRQSQQTSISVSSPTITYMGRSFTAASVTTSYQNTPSRHAQAAPTTPQKKAQLRALYLQQQRQQQLRMAQQESSGMTDALSAIFPVFSQSDSNDSHNNHYALSRSRSNSNLDLEEEFPLVSWWNQLMESNETLPDGDDTEQQQEEGELDEEQRQREAAQEEEEDVYKQSRSFASAAEFEQHVQREKQQEEEFPLVTWWNQIMADEDNNSNNKDSPATTSAEANSAIPEIPTAENNGMDSSSSDSTSTTTETMTMQPTTTTPPKMPVHVEESDENPIASWWHQLTADGDNDHTKTEHNNMDASRSNFWAPTNQQRQSSIYTTAAANTSWYGDYSSTASSTAVASGVGSNNGGGAVWMLGTSNGWDSSSLSLLEQQFAELVYTEQDVLDIASDDYEFARLKRTLKHNGAITNATIQQRMFAFVANRKRRQERQKQKERKQQRQMQQKQDTKKQQQVGGVCTNEQNDETKSVSSAIAA